MTRSGRDGWSWRGIRPLWWFELGWVAVVATRALWFPEPGEHPTAAWLRGAIGALLALQFGLYLLGLAREPHPRTPWLALLAQAALVLAVSWLACKIDVVLGLDLALSLSLALIVAAMATLHETRRLLLAIGGYLLLAFLVVRLVGSATMWRFLVSGKAINYSLLILFLVGGFVLYLHQERAQRQTQALLHDLDLAHADLQHAQLSAYAVRVEELTMLAERQRIARNLHDTLVQGVVGLIMQLDVAQAQLRQGRIARGQGILEQVGEAARDTLADARCALGDLRTGRVRPADLVEVVQEEIVQFTARTAICCCSELDALVLTPARACEHLLRVIAEALTNVERHARARAVWVHAAYDGATLTMTVCDDGMGFDAAMIGAQVGHYGLVGLRERARLVGARLTIASTPGSGTSVQIQLAIMTREEGPCPAVFES